MVQSKANVLLAVGLACWTAACAGAPARAPTPGSHAWPFHGSLPVEAPAGEAVGLLALSRSTVDLSASEADPDLSTTFRAATDGRVTPGSATSGSATPGSAFIRSDDDDEAAPAAEASDSDEAPEPTDSSKPIWNRKRLTGDWWGARTILEENGIDFGMRLSQYSQGVKSGGVKENSEYGATIDYRLNLDGPKALGTWEGFSVNIHARTRMGSDVSADSGAFVLENTGMLSQAPGSYRDTDITGLMLNQYVPMFGGLGLVSIGKIDIIDTVTMFFPNVGYGQEGFWNVNAQVTALPWFGAVEGLSLYGGYVTTINEEHMMPETGILITGTENTSTSWGSLSDSFEEGTWYAAYNRWYWTTEEDNMGFFMLFAGTSTNKQASNDEKDIVVIPGQGVENTDKDTPWDVAAYLYQDFWHAPGDPSRKANFLIGGTGGSKNPQFAHWHVFANVEATGLMESRPGDRMGVGAFYNALSDNFVELLEDVDLNTRDQWGYEMYYNFEINEWLHVTPDLQIVKNERRGDGTAVIAGLRVVIDF